MQATPWNNPHKHRHIKLWHEWYYLVPTVLESDKKWAGKPALIFRSGSPGPTRVGVDWTLHACAEYSKPSTGSAPTRVGADPNHTTQNPGRAVSPRTPAPKFQTCSPN